MENADRTSNNHKLAKVLQKPFKWKLQEIFYISVIVTYLYCLNGLKKSEGMANKRTEMKNNVSQVSLKKEIKCTQYT